MEPRTPLPGSPAARLRRLLIEPAAALAGDDARRTARLLAVFLVCLMALFAATNVAYALTRPGYRLPPADVAGYVLLAFGYAASRSRWPRVGALTMLVMFPLIVFANVVAGTSLNVAASLAFLLPGFVLASIFLPTRGVVAYGTAVSGATLLLPRLAPTAVPALSAVLGSAAAAIITVALLGIAMWHRDSIERDHQRRLQEAYDHALEAWSRALELRDKETEGHSRRVTGLAVQLAEACGLSGDALHDVYRGALLHDIGKMAVPDEILRKPAPLDARELAVMREHPRIAADMLAGIPFLAPALQVALYHHERYDGSGYPEGRRAEAIPFTARIFAVVDVWDALLSDRPYRPAWTRERVTAHLRAQQGLQFDPVVVDRFLALQPVAGSR